MGRRKLEMKRIEDKSSRQVMFSKRRSGLNKKDRQLPFSATSISPSSFSPPAINFTNSAAVVLTVSGVFFLGIRKNAFKLKREPLKRVQATRQVAEEPNELSVTDMAQLEEELSAALMHTRMKKGKLPNMFQTLGDLSCPCEITQMMLEYISTLHEKERNLSEENEEIKQQVLSAKNEKDGCIVVDGGGGLNNLATNQSNSPPRLTLPLF